MLNTVVAVGIWLLIGYLGGEYIIRWNQRFLSNVNSAKARAEHLRLAYRINADLNLRSGISVRAWRILLTAMGAITGAKALLLWLLDPNKKGERK